MIGKVKSKIWEVLETEQLAREDEYYLIFRVIQLLEPELSGQTFGEVILGLKTKGISIGNITRAKRKYFELRESILKNTLKRNLKKQRRLVWSKNKNTYKNMQNKGVD